MTRLIETNILSYLIKQSIIEKIKTLRIKDKDMIDKTEFLNKMALPWSCTC